MGPRARGVEGVRVWDLRPWGLGCWRGILAPTLGWRRVEGNSHGDWD